LALAGTDYVIATFQQGGLEAYKLDIEISQRYGVHQCVEDTLGPGSVFRALRTIPVLLAICDELDEQSPDALLINYVNPMSANCRAVDAGSGRPHVALCHSVQGTSEMLARWVGIPYEKVQFLCAGINHQAWFLDFYTKDEDLYPQLWQAIEQTGPLAEEPVRIELMRHYGSHRNQHPNAGQWQCAQPQFDNEPSGRLLCGSPLSGRCERHSANLSRFFAANPQYDN
jgi:alpha-galactosidase